MEKPSSQSLKLPFKPKVRKPHQKSPPSFRRRRKSGHVVKNGEESDEKEAIQKKIRALQGIVPGGESLAVDSLFELTAEYIMALQCQINAMRALSGFFESFETEKSKRGA